MSVDKINVDELVKNARLLLNEDKTVSQPIRMMVELLCVVVVHQAEQIQRGKEQIQALRDEVAILKGNKPRPKISKSNLEGRDAKKDPSNKKGSGDKRPGSAKRAKTAELDIHESVTLTPNGIGDDWIFKGFSDFIVQGLVIEPHNTKYRRGCWLMPNGETVMAPLPPEVTGHFDATLISYIQHQYFACRVTQPLLLEQLREIGFDISSGQVNNILIENKEEYHEEKSDVLAAGLMVSDFLQVDDTGTRHEGKNGYSTCIGNDLFAFFASSHSKSRINFLEILRAGHEDYLINADALSYMRQQNLPKHVIELLEKSGAKHFPNQDAFNDHLINLVIKSARLQQIVTEAALLASALAHGLSESLVILSDDAGQFNILVHALCWIHVERNINKLVGFTDEQRAAIAKVRDEIWQLYQKLKIYKKSPAKKLRNEIEKEFLAVFTQKTCFETLNQALARILKNQQKLLRVLDYPMIPLHNNSCETDIRDQVTKRKVSGGTQSHLGRLARDTFASLKRTCRKLGVSFWQYLNDRNAAAGNIPNLGELILDKAAAR